MACNWTYKGKVYSEGEFIALMAKGEYDYLFPKNQSWGEKIQQFGEDLEKGVDDFFKQNPTMSVIPGGPQVIKLALKSAAKIIKAGERWLQQYSILLGR